MASYQDAEVGPVNARHLAVVLEAFAVEIMAAARSSKHVAHAVIDIGEGFQELGIKKRTTDERLAGILSCIAAQFLKHPDSRGE